MNTELRVGDRVVVLESCRYFDCLGSAKGTIVSHSSYSGSFEVRIYRDKEEYFDWYLQDSEFRKIVPEPKRNSLRDKNILNKLSWFKRIRFRSPIYFKRGDV